MEAIYKDFVIDPDTFGVMVNSVNQSGTDSAKKDPILIDRRNRQRAERERNDRLARTLRGLVEQKKIPLAGQLKCGFRQEE